MRTRIKIPAPKVAGPGSLNPNVHKNMSFDIQSHIIVVLIIKYALHVHRRAKGQD
jgi:hypothetical protein